MERRENEVHPPGPPQTWLGGNLAEFRRDPLDFLTRCAREYGDVVALRLARRQCLLVSDPALIEAVLVKHSKSVIKHFGVQLARRVLGTGLLTSEGSFWLRQRRMAAPAFYADRIALYGPDMVAATRQLMNDWQNGQERDIHADMMHLTLNIVAKTLFGAEVSDDAHEVDRSLRAALASFSSRISSMIPLPAWVPTPNNLRARRAFQGLNEVVGRIIAQRRKDPKPRADLLSILLHARDEDDGTGMTDDQLADEARTFLLAGHETTALSLSWSWYLLATHSQAQQRLAEELRKVLGSRPPQVSDLPRLKYAEHVILESMRLYPPAFVIGREATAPFELGGYQISPGTTILMSQWVVHRDGRHFERPDEFEPQRWSAERSLPKMAYFPFGGGPRICIGNTFAMLESVLVLATVAQQWEMTLAPEQTIGLAPLFTLRPKEGIRVVLSRREGREQPSSSAK